MKTISISWAAQNYDMECDGEPALVEQETGNKGLGLIVLVLCGTAVLLPSFFTIKNIMDGTATGNPVGALVALFLCFGWPLYWGLKQFFLKRRLVISSDIIKFEKISVWGREKYEEKLANYGQIEYGRSKSQSRGEGGVGVTGTYFVRLPHKDQDRQVTFYEQVRECMSQERLENCSRKLGLPVVDVTPEYTHKAGEFKEMAQAFVDARKKKQSG